jgi:hypothetical protein
VAERTRRGRFVRTRPGRATANASAGRVARGDACAWLQSPHSVGGPRIGPGRPLLPREPAAWRIARRAGPRRRRLREGRGPQGIAVPRGTFPRGSVASGRDRVRAIDCRGLQCNEPDAGTSGRGKRGEIMGDRVAASAAVAGIRLRGSSVVWRYTVALEWTRCSPFSAPVEAHHRRRE